VKNLKEVLNHLKGKGVAIEKTAEYPSYGNFAWVRDPDGNKIELWEPYVERIEENGDGTYVHQSPIVRKTGRRSVCLRFSCHCFK